MPAQSRGLESFGIERFATGGGCCCTAVWCGSRQIFLDIACLIFYPDGLVKWEVARGELLAFSRPSLGLGLGWAWPFPWAWPGPGLLFPSQATGNSVVGRRNSAVESNLSRIHCLCKLHFKYSLTIMQSKRAAETIRLIMSVHQANSAQMLKTNFVDRGRMHAKTRIVPLPAGYCPHTVIQCSST